MQALALWDISPLNGSLLFWHHGVTIQTKCRLWKDWTAICPIDRSISFAALLLAEFLMSTAQALVPEAWVDANYGGLTSGDPAGGTRSMWMRLLGSKMALLMQPGVE